MAARFLRCGYNLFAGSEYKISRRMTWSTSRRFPNVFSGGLDIVSFHTSPEREGVTPINMPSLSPTMTEGTIVKWHKKEGDKMHPGDMLCEIQTDKAVMSVEVDEEGILAKVLHPDDSPNIKVGSLIALMVDEGEDWKNVEIPKDVKPSENLKSEKKESLLKTKSIVEETKDSNQERLIGPSVKHLLAKYGLDSSQVPRNGPHGALLKGDVLNYALENNLKPVEQDVASVGEKATAKGQKSTVKGQNKTKDSSAPFVDIPVTNMRRTIAKRLLESKGTIPHAYCKVEASVSNMTNLRKRMVELGFKVSVNDFVIKAVSNVLQNSPAINVNWEGSRLKQNQSVDIAVAVSTDSGLITPIITNVPNKDVLAISSDMKALAEKARLGKLQPHEFMGGSFSISNLGMYGIYEFSAIINPPQCAILAVGGINISLAANGFPKSVTHFTLSFDSSAITDEDAAKFMALLKHEVESISEASMQLHSVQDRMERLYRESTK